MIDQFKFDWKPVTFAAVTSLVVFCGCGGSEEASGVNPDEGLSAEAIAVRDAFETASPSKKGTVTEMLSLVRTGSTNRRAYMDVLPQLKTLSTNPTLTTEQKQAVEALVQQIQTELSGTRS